VILPAQAQPLPGGGRLDGHVVVVTGAGSRGEQFGVGRATAIAAALEGARVVLVDRVADDARRTAEMSGLERACQMLVVEADTTSPDDTQAAADAAVERFGGIDALVNNVGIVGAPGTAEDVDLVEWQRGLEVNVTSGMLMTKACLPHLVRSRLGASIVNLTSVAGMRGGHPNLLYPTAKAAVINMTRAMAFHHGRQGVRVNAVAPGMIETPMVGGEEMPEEVRRQRIEAAPLGTSGTAWDVAKAIVFLCSADARWISGVLLPVDAGLTAAAPRPAVVDASRSTGGA
jgi:NAD(P)-dependent dehydrogenase (short-subunit alcohol dehydrogenase family)